MSLVNCLSDFTSTACPFIYSAGCCQHCCLCFMIPASWRQGDGICHWTGLLCHVTVTVMIHIKVTKHHIAGLVQERRNSSALAMEFHLSCINPSMPWALWIAKTPATRLFFFQQLVQLTTKEMLKLHITALCEGNPPVPMDSPHKRPIIQKFYHVIASSLGPGLHCDWLVFRSFPVKICLSVLITHSSLAKARCIFNRMTWL